MHTALEKDLNLVGTLDAVEIAERIKNEELRMIVAVAALKNDRDRAVKALTSLEKETGTPGLKDAVTKVLDEHSEEGTATPPLVQMRFKSSNLKEIIERVVDEGSEHNDNEILHDLSSNSWRRLHFFVNNLFF